MVQTSEAQFPNDATTGHDLDPNADGDLTVDVALAHTEALIIAAQSVDNQNFSVSVDWTDGADNVFATDSATDLSLSGVSEGSAFPNRKAPRAEVTFTSDATAGTQNRINAFVDAHR